METQFLPDHPDAAQEQRHLCQTMEIIQDEIAKLEAETHIGAEEERTVVVPEGLDSDEQVAMNLMRAKVDLLHNLARSRRQAYFARLDFTPQNDASQTHYIGRWGVMKTPELDVTVVDWRSPVANLYYSGQVGPMDYDAPDGHVQGELTLKRMLTVHGDRLEGVFDSGVVGQDAYLQSVLGSVTGDRLREIVTTIQSEQNLVIRHPHNAHLIVQGVAGSGKTTIALHRIAYLLYAQRGKLQPEQMMILAPNPLFLNYISQVLPDLGVERVRQTTFVQLCLGWMGKHAPKLAAARRMEDKLTATPEQRTAMAAILRRKGSIAMMQQLQTYLNSLQTAMLPEDDLTFGGTLLMSNRDLRELFLVQLKPWPLVRRIEEARKAVKRRLDRLCDEMRRRMTDMAANRLETLLASMPDSDERRARAARLLDSRDARLKEIDDRAKQYLKDFPSLFPALTLLSVYRDYITRYESDALQADTLPNLDKKRVRQEDLAPLCTIAEALYGLPRDSVQQLVMDECQDFSPYQLAMLRKRYPGATFTLVGDLMQGIHADEGIGSYDEWLEPVFAGKAELRTLLTSYRSTAEIITLAGRVAMRHPVPDQQAPKPVLRHGSKPTLTAFNTDHQRLTAIADQVQSWQAQGYHTIALIEKTEASAKKLLKTLPSALDAHLVTEDDAAYTGGVLVMAASMVKGLEFDCALLCNVSKDEFPDDAFWCRMLYVMCTRPLHELTVFALGELSALLDP